MVRDYLIERFGEQIAEDIKPLEIQKWLKSLNESNGLAWTTIAKMRGIMHRIYKIGILHELVTKNLVQHVETRSKTDYKAIVITPAQTLAILTGCGITPRRVVTQPYPPEIVPGLVESGGSRLCARYATRAF